MINPLLTITCLLVSAACFAQSITLDSLNTFLVGKWKWTNCSGGIAGQGCSQPGPSYSVVFFKHPNEVLFIRVLSGTSTIRSGTTTATFQNTGFGTQWTIYGNPIDPVFGDPQGIPPFINGVTYAILIEDSMHVGFAMDGADTYTYHYERDTTYIATCGYSTTVTVVDATCGEPNGFAYVSASGSFPPFDFRWSTVPVLTDDTAANLFSGNYLVTISDVTGCETIVSLTVANDSDCVWPGDANANGIANNQDVLAIGVAYGFAGTPRPNATTNWIAQPCPDWVDTFGNGVNFKHADCNGEGVVDSNDVAVISLNYGLTHAKNSSPEKMANPDLFLVFPQDSFQTGDTVSGEIHLGSQTTPVNDVYGIAFSITYNQNIIDSNGISVDFINSWFTPNSNRIGLAKDLYSASKVDIGLSRTSHSNASGSGAIANVSFVIQDNIDGKDYFVLPLELQFEDVIAIDKDEAEVNITANGDTLYVEGATVGVKPIHQKHTIRIFPNPASNEINVVADVAIVECSILDITGREVLKEIPSLEGMESLTLSIDISALETGSYFIQLETADHYSVCRKLVVSR